jgi:hypothetical protein
LGQAGPAEHCWTGGGGGDMLAAKLESGHAHYVYIHGTATDTIIRSASLVVSITNEATTPSFAHLR